MARPRKPPVNLESGTYTLEETAKRLGIGTATAYRLAASGELPVRVYNIGGQKRTLKAQVERFLTDGEILENDEDDDEEPEPIIPVRRRRRRVS
ncbi:MAG: helix-turn-helix domain-containing protein [Acidimicrobiaceae bacterium]|nr:helix-turn-helix domain-containing protein [Acidimicrobiaceae bacterium]